MKVVAPHVWEGNFNDVCGLKVTHKVPANHSHSFSHSHSLPKRSLGHEGQFIVRGGDGEREGGEQF